MSRLFETKTSESQGSCWSLPCNFRRFLSVPSGFGFCWFFWQRVWLGLLDCCQVKDDEVKRAVEAVRPVHVEIHEASVLVAYAALPHFNTLIESNWCFRPTNQPTKQTNKQTNKPLKQTNHWLFPSISPVTEVPASNFKALSPMSPAAMISWWRTICSTSALGWVIRWIFLVYMLLVGESEKVL